MIINVEHGFNYVRAFIHERGKDHRTLDRRYYIGEDKPRYPMPAIPLAVKYDYIGCINIDDVSDIADPIIVYMYDSWTGQNV